MNPMGRSDSRTIHDDLVFDEMLVGDSCYEGLGHLFHEVARHRPFEDESAIGKSVANVSNRRVTTRL